MSAWRWLWAWFGEPERPARRQAAGPIGDAVPGWGEPAGRRAARGRTRARGRSRRSLPPATRAELERALGADLADLSLTIDPGFTAALDARAVQLGSTIVLGDPADAQTLPLLAHEPRMPCRRGSAVRDRVSAVRAMPASRPRCGRVPRWQRAARCRLRPQALRSRRSSASRRRRARPGVRASVIRQRSGPC